MRPCKVSITMFVNEIMALWSSWEIYGLSRSLEPLQEEWIPKIWDVPPYA